MAEPADNLPAETGTADDQVICSKCGASNHREARRCVDCDAHLYVRCYSCRRRNERAALNCVACGRPMKATTIWRFKRGLQGENARLLWLVPTMILFLILGVMIASYFTPVPVKPRGNHPAAIVPPALTNEENGISFPAK